MALADLSGTGCVGRLGGRRRVLRVRAGCRGGGGGVSSASFKLVYVAMDYPHAGPGIWTWRRPVPRRTRRVGGGREEVSGIGARCVVLAELQ